MNAWLHVTMLFHSFSTCLLNIHQLTCLIFDRATWICPAVNSIHSHFSFVYHAISAVAFCWLPVFDLILASCLFIDSALCPCLSPQQLDLFIKVNWLSFLSVSLSHASQLFSEPWQFYLWQQVSSDSALQTMWSSIIFTLHKLVY